jgi:hypothetical protein
LLVEFGYYFFLFCFSTKKQEINRSVLS